VGSMRTTASRGLAVLALLLGLLAMHGLAGTHRAAASPHGVAEGARHHAAAAPADAVLPAPAPSCDGDCPELAALCVVVLAAATLALLLVRRDLAGGVLPAPVRARAPLPVGVRPRGPDPVRELCVSRT
jgi:hypothetical protein